MKSTFFFSSNTKYRFITQSFFMFFSAFGLAQQVPKPMETISVFHNKNEPNNKVFTADNQFVNPDKLAHASNSVADIILLTPGTDLNGQGGLFQSYNIRGFSRNRIKTEVDGIPIVTDRRAGNALSFIPPEFISGVNIHKGPSSTLYGSDAMGGVISVSTYNEFDSEISVFIQPEDNSQQIHGKFAGEATSLGALYRKSDNAQSPNGTPLNTEYEQSFAAITHNRAWETFDIYFSALLNKGNDLGKSSASYPENKISSYPKDDHFLAQIEISQPDSWLLKFYHHNQHWQSETKRLDDNKDISRTNVSDYQSDTWGSYGQYTIENTRLGLEWLGRRNIKIREQEFNAQDIFQWEVQSVNAKEDTLSVYASHEWNFNHTQGLPLIIATGIRYDWMQVAQFSQSQEDDFVSFSLSAKYQVKNTTSLTAEVASAFRFPSVSELFYSGETPRGNTQGNPELSPEKSIGYQISFIHTFNPVLTVTLNTYFYHIDDYIERYTLENISTEQVKSYRNSEQVTIKGLELISQWNLTNALSSQLSLQIASGKDKNHNALDDTLPNALKWSLYWQTNLFNKTVDFSNNMVYQFAKNSVGPSETSIEEELIWNASLSSEIVTNQILTLSILNITDNTYSSSADEDAALQPERTWNIKWTYTF